MKTREILPAALLVLVAGVALLGLTLTRHPAPPVPLAHAGLPATKAHDHLVDETPLITARHLVPLAATAAERDLARQAERTATHEVDLSFADALRLASEAPPPADPATRALLARRDAAATALAEQERHLAELARQAAATPGPAREEVEDRLEMAKAEHELATGELAQLSEDLERAGADPQARIRRLKAAHQAVEPVAAGGPPASAAFQPGSGLARLARLNEARVKLALLRKACQESRDKGQRMARRRAEFAVEVQRREEELQAAKQDAASFSRTPGAAGARGAGKATLKTLKHHLSDQWRLADYGRRIQDAAELEELYGTWTALVTEDFRVALRAVLAWALAVLAVLGAVLAADRYFEHLFTRLMEGANRVGRMLKVVKYATQALGAVIIVILAVGLPSQLTTLVGLAGAGLTVAMKDFITAFFGWFILVGRNGIHVGDWVEIQGVGGEVVEIGLLRTFLLETGNWTDSSHPTGRVVSFVNSFAMDKHFFNFSSSGKWLWDELQVRVPQGRDPYAFVDAVRGLVERETSANAVLARKEWDQAGRRSRSGAISTEPAIDVVPTADGVEVRVRYLTRAFERHATARVLNQALLELLHGPRPAQASAPS